jgi:hypothetical protein
VIAAEVTNLAMDAPAYAPMVAAAKTNLTAAGERRRLRRVVADAGYRSVDNVALKGVESFIVPGRARQLKIAEAEQARIAIPLWRWAGHGTHRSHSPTSIHSRFGVRVSNGHERRAHGSSCA